MPLLAQTDGVFVVSDGREELHLSGAGFRVPDEFRSLVYDGPVSPWNDIVELRWLPPDPRIEP